MPKCVDHAKPGAATIKECFGEEVVELTPLGALEARVFELERIVKGNDRASAERTGIVAAMEQADEIQRAHLKQHANWVAQRARAEAFEEIADMLDNHKQHDMASTVRAVLSLKSQPAAQENDTMQWKPDPTFRGVPILPHQQREEIIKPAAQASAENAEHWRSDYQHTIANMTHDIASLRKERDELRAKLAKFQAMIQYPNGWQGIIDDNATLRAKLAEAEKALDDILHYWKQGEDHDGWCCIKGVLQSTGRLTPRKQEEGK